MSTNYNNIKKLEKLLKHTHLTLVVKIKIREHKQKLENEIGLMDVLLEKPTLYGEEQRGTIK